MDSITCKLAFDCGTSLHIVFHTLAFEGRGYTNSRLRERLAAPSNQNSMRAAIHTPEVSQSPWQSCQVFDGGD